MSGNQCICLNQTCEYKDSLVTAAERGHDECVNKLCEKLDRLKMTTLYKEAYYTLAFITAAKCGHVKSMETLLDYGADIYYRNVDVDDPILAASEEGHAESIALLLTNRRFDLEELSSAFLAATKGGHVKVMQILLDHGATVNCTCLDIAIAEGHVQALKLLLSEQHYSLNKLNHGLWTAVEKGDVDVVQILLQSKADPNFSHSDKNVLIHAIDREGNHDMRLIDILLRFGASVNKPGKIPNTYGYSWSIPDYKQPWKNQSNIIQLVMCLLVNGADIRKINIVGSLSPNIPLTIAIRAIQLDERAENFDANRLYDLLNLLSVAGGQHIVFQVRDNYPKTWRHVEKLFPNSDTDLPKTVPMLVDCCRPIIRAHLMTGFNNNLIQAVSKLELPRSMMKFLLMDLDVPGITIPRSTPE